MRGGWGTAERWGMSRTTPAELLPIPEAECALPMPKHWRCHASLQAHTAPNQRASLPPCLHLGQPEVPPCLPAPTLASRKCISALPQFWCRRSTMPLFSCTLPLRQHTCRHETKDRALELAH